MASLKLISAALLAAAVVAAPATARVHHVRHVANDVAAAVAVPPAAFAGSAYSYGYHCIPAPRVGAFAGQPWDTIVPCEPAYAPQGGYY
jgi:hypothetical protein